MRQMMPVWNVRQPDSQIGLSPCFRSITKTEKKKTKPNASVFVSTIFFISFWSLLSSFDLSLRLSSLLPPLSSSSLSSSYLSSLFLSSFFVSSTLSCRPLGLHGSLFNFCWWKVLMFRFLVLVFCIAGPVCSWFWASLGQENLTVSVAANGSEEVCGKALMNVTWLDDWSHIFILFWCFDCALIVFDWFWFVSLTSRLKSTSKVAHSFLTWHFG